MQQDVTTLSVFGAKSKIAVNLIALRKAKIVCSFGLSECKRVNLCAMQFGNSLDNDFPNTFVT